MVIHSVLTGSSTELVQSDDATHNGSVKHAVISGGTGGLGQAIERALSNPGSDWQVTAFGRKDLDLHHLESIQPWFLHRRVDLLVCAAGITSDAPLARLREKSWDETLRINLSASLACARAAIAGMLQNEIQGQVVFISSYSAIHPPIGQVAYATAKAALLGATKDLAAEFGAKGIRVNSILPGFLETPMTASVSPSRREQVLAEHQLGAFNDCEAVAGFIRFLHENLPHTSGQIFQLDSRL
ncbi:SDR family NAD(P)-dependent oxidoreductase [Luteolibacter pohnpeiensis]|uniref:SDR family NAD(P)-dependent oxidoreductase n=1 Tax=Luteolibacter pohnpeiensis TaxID=454153 RepID=A0A934VUA5_9BACT|nr:SDR family NAD(P)-dependent oxidoreductase [Luteolibacter pohnpeiensis]MBK1882322.1 SDR family NAD(P)-dependent oxidoreductase [Luteolibacter pohnpeiensis]